MKECMIKAAKFFDSCKNFPPLFFRLALAYGFFSSAYFKLTQHDSAAQLFASLNMPFPEFTSYFVGIIEALGVCLLTVGLMTRWISALLTIVMLVAVFGVHIPTHTDFTVPMWFGLGLLSLMTTGAGRYSLDHSFCCCEKAVLSSYDPDCDSEDLPKISSCCESEKSKSSRLQQVGCCGSSHSKSSDSCCRH